MRQHIVHARDIPLFTSATVEALTGSGAELACPACGGRRGHPILMSAGVAERVISDSGEGGLQGALERCGTEVTEIEVDDPGILLDADTPEDYAELLEIHNRAALPARDRCVHSQGTQVP